MGCDIHGFWEFKTPDNKWIAFEHAIDARSYRWFGIIANVRNQLCINNTSRRGIPADASQAWSNYTQSWGRGLHSHTWLTPHEIDLANRELYRLLKEDEENDLDITRFQFKPHEPIPEYSDEVSHILLPGPNNLVSMIWTGTLAENTGTEDLAQHLRFVVAFDN